MTSLKISSSGKIFNSNSSDIISGKPKKVTSIKKKAVKKFEDQIPQIAASKSKGALPSEKEIKTLIKKNSGPLQTASKFMVLKKSKTSEKNESKLKMLEKKACGESMEENKKAGVKKKVLSKKAPKENGTIQIKTVKTGNGKQQKAVIRPPQSTTTSKVPSGLKKVTKKMIFQRRELSDNCKSKPKNSKNNSSCTYSDLKLNLSCSSMSLNSSLPQLVNINLLINPTDINKREQFDHWGFMWKEGINYDPRNDEEFLSRIQDADKKGWKVTKFKKRVSVSPELSEIDEESNESLLIESLQKGKIKLRSRIGSCAKFNITERKQTKQAIRH